MCSNFSHLFPNRYRKLFRDISVSKRGQDIGINLNVWYGVINISKCDEKFCVVMVAGPNYAVNNFTLVFVIKFCT